ncbi:MAG: excinuclease ABC subunit UvrC, partial [Clostridia bacterium]|nr:excinuclease ABC subunit UvrC [Clostridia bacterium]
SMCEAITRRFAHLSDADGGFSKLPDLILLDGGATHVGAVTRVLEQMGITVPVFGMVKDDFHKTRALCTEHEEISIAQDRAVFTAIYRIQEEVHRFSLKRMSDAKRGSIKSSVLEKIPGVGKAKAKCLLAHFGGLAPLRRATREEIAAAPGVGPVLAEAVYQHFHKEERS